MTDNNKEKMVVIIGPTAVGKTKMSIEAARRLNGEIISGDSMQVYRTLDIGTAKVTKEEMQEIPHHMIDIIEPKESFSVAQFQSNVKEHIHDINSRGKLPILVGGTGLYIQSVIYGYNFSESGASETYRSQLENEVEIYGIKPIYERLKKVDPEAAEKIHPNNTRRVIRALEIYEQTGLTMTEYQEKQQLESPYDYMIFGLMMDREKLYERINLRVDIMMETGLLEEVKGLYESGLRDHQSVQAIGYKELYQYLDGDITLEAAIELLKRNSRRYAKRQLTWFRNKMDVNWIDMGEKSFEENLEQILVEIAGKLGKKAN